MQKFTARLADRARAFALDSAAVIRALPAVVLGRIRLFPAAAAAWMATVGVTIRALPYLIASFGRRSGDFVLSFNSMLVVVLKRLRHNLGITISAIVGIIAILAMVVCVPVFSHAVSSEVLRSQLEEKAASTHRGLFSLHLYYIDQPSASAVTVDASERVTAAIRETSIRLMGLQPAQVIREIQSKAINWRAVKTQYNLDATDPWFAMAFFSLEDLPKHAVLVEGQWPAASSGNGQPIQVAIMENTADDLFLNVGDIYRFRDSQIQISGIWKPISLTDTYWFQNPTSAYSSLMWIPLESFRSGLRAFLDRPLFYVSWYVVMDEAGLSFDHAPVYSRGLVRMDFELKGLLPGLTNDYSPLAPLNDYQKRADTLTTLFYAVGSPMVILALLFVSLTATIAVQQYEQETATMRGRGTSWLQVVGLNIIESLVLIVIAVLPGLLTGWLAASLMGKTLSFLRFTNREGIPFTFEGINILWLGLAGLTVIVSRLMPVLGVSRTSIVRMKQEQSRGMQKPLWQRFYLDFLLLLPGIYAYVTMSGLASSNQILARLQAPATGQYRDMVLYVAPALFAMALCMLVLRLLPGLLRLLAWVVERLPQVWAYLSIQQIARRPQDHSSALLLIMISLSLAIYSASTAKTLDRWLHDSAYYKSGADLAVHEYVIKGGDQTSIPGMSASTPSTLSESDLNLDSTINLEEHLKLPAVEGVTRVGKYEGSFSFGVGEQQATFMGIDRLDFPKVAFFRDDFSSESFGALMNELGSDLNAVLIPRALAKEKGFRLGDKINTSVRIFDQSYDRELVIAGFYDYFATVFPGENPTLIVNLDSIFDNPEAVIGYDIWLKLRADADIPLLQYQLAKLVGGDKGVITVRGNAYDDVKKMMDQPERVGLFGILNVGFLMTGLMPGIGFVLYSYASLRRRFIQLGILQAIGLSVRQLIGYLASEQFLLMGLAILSGAAIGLVSSYLFVPFLQVGAATGAPVPPFEVLIGWVESGVLSLVFGLILVLTMVGTIASLVRMKVFQAVKMGETL